MTSFRVCVVVAALAACAETDQRPDPETGMAEAEMPDAGPSRQPEELPEPTLTVTVAPSGSDLHDGIDKPVETLRRAIEIAKANPRVTDISMQGTYTVRGGETFPYVVPRNLVISGGKLVGTGTETALIVEGGEVQNVSFDKFAVAIDAAGPLRLQDLHVTNTGVAVRGHGSAKLRIDNLDVTGIEDACTTGIALEGAAELFGTTLTMQRIGAGVDAIGDNTIDIANAQISSLGRVRCSGDAISVVTTRPFRLSDSSIDGGRSGVHLEGRATGLVPATIVNIQVQGAGTGVRVRGMALQLTGGSFFSNGQGFVGGVGTSRLTGAQIVGNNSGGVSVGGDSATQLAALTMRDCRVANSSFGTEILDFVTADLGTREDSGRNTLSDGFFRALRLRGNAGPSLVRAVGNTWLPNIQQSDSNGRYPETAVVVGPIELTDENRNFVLDAGWSLER